MKKAFLTFLLSLVTFLNFAAVETFSERLSGVSVATGGVMTVYDDKYYEMSLSGWNNAFYNKQVKNKITLGYLPNHQLAPAGAVQQSVKLRLRRWTWNGSGFTASAYDTITLTVTYDSNSGALVDDLDSYVFTGAHSVEIRVLSTTSSSSNIYVESEIEVERYYHMSAVAPTHVGYRYPIASPTDLEFFWDPAPGAESYELEWTFVSNYSLTTPGGIAAASSLNYDFYKNSTRVRVDGTSYRIPALFNRGYVLFRVRKIGFQGVLYALKQESAWSAPTTGTVSLFPAAARVERLTDYAPGKNWSHEVGYAEDGKRFESISYGDGLGRGRQNISHNTATGQVIVSNVYYDRVGRAVVSDLPTPVNGESMEHRPNFNSGVYLSVTSPYGPIHFDNPEAAVCNPVTNPFSTTIGTGNYYSNQNPDLTGEKAYIPDAAGYPFAQVEYMSDQTGRIRRTGGYGRELQLDKHATTYYYDIPLQSELNKLFGTEAGYNMHYQRRITIDGNKQAYAEYFDLAGRVVAHCLLGDAPTGLDALSNNTGPVVETQPVYTGTTAQQYDSQQAIARFDYVQTVVNAGVYQFTHQFVPATFTDNCLPANFCFDCLYDFELKITSINCPTETPTYLRQEHINGWQIDALCNGSGYDTTFAILTLQPGQYQVSKLLRVSPGAAEAYWCDFIDNSTCAPDYNALYNAALAETDFQCTLPNSLPEEGPVNDCAVYRRMLRSDVSPGGQYGLVNFANGTATDALSIFRLPNDLTGSGSWRTPFGNYLNGDGSVAKIYVSVINGQQVPTSLGTVYNDASGSFVYPQQLEFLADFLDYWQPSWGDVLVPYHPEYCYLQFCEAHPEYQDFSQQLAETDTYAEACAGGYFNPLLTGINPVPNPIGTSNPALELTNCATVPAHADQMFTSTHWTNTVQPWFTGSHQIPTIPERLNSFYKVLSNGVVSKVSLWEYAVWQAHCPQLPMTSGTQIHNNCITQPLTACEKEDAWRIFKTEYQKIRREYYLIAQTAYVSYKQSEYAVGGPCAPAFNGCIGQTTYSSGDFLQFDIRPGFYKPNSSTQIAVNTASGPCASGTASLYANKQRRFSNLPALNANPVTFPNGQADVDAYIAEELETHCATVCNAYADGWMAQLDGCNLTTTEKANIRAGLIQVCQDGCSLENPGGATTVDPDGGSSGYASFQAVLQAVLPANRYPSAVCSEYLISEPRAYGQNALQEATAQLDACGCDILLQTRADFAVLSNANQLPAGVTSVEGLLAYQRNITLLSAQALLCACEKALAPNAWTSGNWSTAQQTALANLHVMALPELSCTASVCSDCAAIQAQQAAFLAHFPQAGFATHPNYGELYENYLNQALGYHLRYEQYEAFLENCSATSNTPSCEVTQLGLVFRDLLDVIARQGKLVTPLSTPYVLSQNIVHQYSPFATVAPGNYWSSISGNTITLNFGTSVPTAQTMTFALPAQADFTFADIIGISDIAALNACTGDNVRLGVRVVVCGQIQTRFLTGRSNQLALVQCYCSGNLGVLCDERDFIPRNICYRLPLEILNGVTEDAYAALIATQKTAFLASYTAKCATAFDAEVLTMSAPQNFYQHTLFYYDQAGNLVKTVAPSGRDLTFSTPANLNTVNAKRNAAQPNAPNQDFDTRYAYNSYNQLTATSNPDQQGDTRFWYDRFGRIVASQNPVQADLQTYSYTFYDAQGRPVQTGQVKKTTGPSESSLKGSNPDSYMQSWVMTGVVWEVTITTYDAPLTPAISAKFVGGQQHLRLRVATVAYFDTILPTTTQTTGYTSAIHYSYDPHGNVIEQLQDVPQMAVVDLAVKSTQYEFELISGNVQKVSYQKGQKDAFTHTYQYDQLNRLTEVFTSSDGVHETREAHYRYYDHGPLARVETGQYQVQGQDFAYTINGWLKGMNASTLDNSRDIGKDGAATGYLTNNNTVHGYFAKDVTAYTLGYYDQDYKAAGTSTMEATYSGTLFGDGATNLYNGNIRHLVTSIQGMTTLGHTYRYDQLQRLKNVNSWYLTGTGLTGNSWNGMADTLDYNSSYTYDANGNLLTLNRNATGTSAGTKRDMDRFTYTYGLHPNGERWNRLASVQDAAANYTIAPYEDIKQGTSAYEYDKLGQLLKDPSNTIASIRWRLGDKKVSVINHSAANAPQVKFIYDPFGRRVAKIVTPKSANVLQANRQFTYYARDANGQEMAVYVGNMNANTPSQNTATLDEQYLYGAARLGVRDAAKLLYSNGPVTVAASSYYKNTLGKRNYELSNYLGNVQAVITDRRTYSAGGYLATLVMSADYYAFGMAMPGRTFNSANYRYGYNGMEKDDEVKSGGNSYTTEFRQYDPRVGRWLSLDPLMIQFPHTSPYIAFDNNPIRYTDPQGLKSITPGEPEIPDANAGSEHADSPKIEEDPDWLMDRATVVGTRAHTTLDIYFKALDPRSKNWISNKALGNKKRPDLLYIGSIDKRGSVWELKPDSRKNPARTTRQVNGYVDQLNREKPYKKTKWVAGNSNKTPLPFKGQLVLESDDGKYTFTYSIPSPSDGLIYYTTTLNEKQKKPQPVPVVVPVLKKVPAIQMAPMPFAPAYRIPVGPPGQGTPKLDRVPPSFSPSIKIPGIMLPIIIEDFIPFFTPGGLTDNRTLSA